MPWLLFSQPSACPAHSYHLGLLVKHPFSREGFLHWASSPSILSNSTILSPHSCALLYFPISVGSDHNLKYSSFSLLVINTIEIIRVVRKDLCARLLTSVSFYQYAAAAAKSLQSCPTLCDPIDGSPPGSHPWDSPGENTGVGCHFLLQCMKVKSESEVAQSCPTSSDSMDCS